MKVHRNCISDRIAQEYWRDYQHVMRKGNPMGMSFTEYVAARVAALQPRVFTTATANTPAVTWYIAQCGHSHPWGESCSSWTAT